MLNIRNTIAIGAISTLAAAQTTAPKLDATCADVVIFMARGNDAPYHDTRTTPFIDATCAKLNAQGKTCDYIDIQFDVTLGGDYCAQVAEGARNGQSQVTAFQAKCPCTHIVINGYSEGAHVVGDVLGGPGGCTKVSDGISNTSAAGKAIAAALVWGDVMHTANQPYNVLDGADKQKNPRSAADLALLNRYAPVLRSYCAAGDPVCAGGSNVADHLNYFELYTDDASSWVVGKIDGTADLCPATSSTPVSSATASASSVVVPASSVVVPASSAVVPASSGVVPVPSGTAPGSSVVTPAPSSTKVEPSPATTSCSTSAVTPAPFPPAVPYGTCVQAVKVVYTYV